MTNYPGWRPTKYAAALTAGLLTILTGCAAGNPCDGWRPIQMRPRTADFITRNDVPAALAVLGHNEHGRSVCGW